MNIYEQVKELVPVRQAAELYGYHPNRAGFVCCPWHNERTASLKLYPGDRGFYCFGCGRGGSVVDFVGELFGLSPMEAVRRLNQDFNLGLPLDKPLDRQTAAEIEQRRRTAETREQFEAWRERTANDLNAAYRGGWLALRDKPPESWTEGEAAAVRLLPVLEAWADTLCGDDMAEIMVLWRDRKRVRERCLLILSCTKKKSKVA